ncbi:MAG: amino acid adenylation domain-containing protein [Candidatus Omnitrophota bacterium]
MKKLEKKNVVKILPLTPMQEGMLFHYLKSPQDHIYFEQLSLRISGEVKTDLFEKAWNWVIDANEMLRTVFRWEKLDKPTQIVLKEHRLKLLYNDISEIAPEEKERSLQALKEKDRGMPFNLRQIPFRVSLIKIEECCYEMVISNHHILYDGWSNGILLKEFFNAYHGLEKGIKPLLEVKPSFQEFIRWIQTRDKQLQEEFWKDYLYGFEGSTELPIKKRKTDELSEFKKNSIVFEEIIKHNQDRFTQNRRITLASLFYAAWGMVFQRYCGSNDVIVGTTVSGRPAAIRGIEDMVGLFINTLPLRIRTSPEETLLDVVSGIDRTLKAREAFESTPLVEIQRYSGLSSGISLFDTIVVVENYPLDNRLLPLGSPLSIHSYSMVEMTHYDLMVSVLLFDTIKVHFSYRETEFDPKSIDNLCTHFKRVVQNILENETQKMCQLEILSEEEKNRILYDFNHTETDYPKDKTIHELFEEQAARTPNRIALLGGTSVGADPRVCPHVSYKELSDRSDQLASGLIEQGVKADSIVGLKIERSIEMIMGILGILKAGGAYLPIDPDYPPERIDYMLTDSRAQFLCLTEHTGDTEKGVIEVEKLRSWEIKKVFFIEHLILSPSQPLNLFPSPPLNFSLQPATGDRRPATRLAYIIYTSGSTGNPKGVMISHYNAVNFITGMVSVIDFSPGKVILALTTISFDIFFLETVLSLTAGLKVVMASERQQKDPALLETAITRNGVDMLQVTPSRLQLLLAGAPDLICLKEVKELIIGGEALPPELLERLKEKFQGRIYNVYGPTETTVWSTLKELTEEKRITIGTPIANTQVYILNRNIHVQPIGIPGECYIAGEGVSRGYLNNPELTAERFKRNVSSHWSFVKGKRSAVPNDQCPMTNDHFLPNGCFYKTGDLARWLNDGAIEFLGRIDHQVKIRGFRIELGEIERRLLTYPGIKETVVICRDSGDGDKDLCAYFVSHEEITARVLKDYLATYLPGYMVPVSVTRIDRIPLTLSGKVDRKALPAPRSAGADQYTAPRGTIEEGLCRIWSELLGLDENHISMDSNFFGLGGHSLRAISLVALIQKEFDANLPLGKIFEYPTIRRQAELINESAKEHFMSIGYAEEKEYYVLSSAQKRLYILQHLQLDHIGYNMPIILDMEGHIETEQLEETFGQLIRRHDNFRTAFEMVNDEPVQRVYENTDFKIDYYKTAIKEEVETIVDGFVKPFLLHKAPLLRVGLIEMNTDRFVLMLDMHHIISDAVSINLFVKEFIRLYGGKKLPALKFQYKDYSEWQASESEKELLKTQEIYWLEQFKGDIPLLNLPMDYIRPLAQSFEGNVLEFEMGKEKAQLLRRLILDTRVTLHIVMLAIYNILISKISGQEDIIIGVPIAGRKHADVREIFGVFVNMLATRNNLKANMTFLEFLEHVRRNALDSFDNQEYPFETLVDILGLKRQPGRNPLFDVLFIAENDDNRDGEITAFEIPGLKVKRHGEQSRIAKYDLLFYVYDSETIRMKFEYCTKLFKKETIDLMARYVIEIVDAVFENRNVTLSQIQLSQIHRRPEVKATNMQYQFLDNLEEE